jgi:hypothetical protein
LTVTCTQAPPGHISDTGVIGRVVREGQPVEGAYVRLSGSQGEFVAEIRTRTDGAFQFYVVPGDWTLVCLAPGAIREEQRVPLRRGEVVNADISLVAVVAGAA